MVAVVAPVPAAPLVTHYLRSLRGAIARVDQATHKLLWRHAIELAGQIETEMGLARGCLGGQIAIEIAQGGPGRAVGVTLRRCPH